MTDTQKAIIQEGQAIIDLLIRKNQQYGDSALSPANIFAKGDPLENIACRIDDKLMRIKNGGVNENTIDTVDDLIGYLILYKIAYKKTVEC